MTQRLPIIDLYRGCSALIVVLAHVRGTTFVPYGQLEAASQNLFTLLLFGLTRFAKEAVIAFFLVSGFLVGGKYLESASHSDFDWRDYVAARLARIYTVLIPVLLITGCFIMLVQQENFPLKDLFVNFIGLQDRLGDANKHLAWGGPFGRNEPLWTLSYEIWFYVMIGGLCTLYSAYTRPSRAIGNVILSLALLCLSIYVLFVNKKLDFVAALIFGSALYFVECNTAWSKVCRWAGIIALIPSVIVSQLSLDSVSITRMNVDERLATVLVFLSLGLVLLGNKNYEWSRPGRYVGEVLWKPVLAISSISYSLYLIHYVVLLRVLGNARYDIVSTATVCVAFAKLAVCLLAGSAVYWLFERHTHKVKTLLRRNLLSPSDASSVMAVSVRSHR